MINDRAIKNRKLKQIDATFRESPYHVGWNDWHDGPRNFYDNTKDLDTMNLIGSSAKIALGRSNFANIGDFRDAVLSKDNDAEYHVNDSLHINNINALVFSHMASVQRNDIAGNDIELLASQHRLESLYSEFREVRDQLDIPSTAQSWNFKYEVPTSEAYSLIVDDLTNEWDVYQGLAAQYEKDKVQSSKTKTLEKPSIKEQIKAKPEYKQQLAQQVKPTAKPKLNIESVLKQKEAIRDLAKAPKIAENRPNLKVAIKDRYNRQPQEPVQVVKPLTKEQQKDLKTVTAIRNLGVDHGPASSFGPFSKSGFADRLHGYTTGDVLRNSRKLGYTIEQAQALALADIQYIRGNKFLNVKDSESSQFWNRQVEYAENARLALFKQGLETKNTELQKQKGIVPNIYEKAKEKLGMNKHWLDRELGEIGKSITNKQALSANFTQKLKAKVEEFMVKATAFKNTVIDKATGNYHDPLEQRKIDAKKLQSRVDNPHNTPARQAYYKRLQDYSMAGSKTLPGSNAEAILKAQKLTTNDLRILEEKYNTKGISRERKDFYGRMIGHTEVALNRINEREADYLSKTGHKNLQEGLAAEKEAKAQAERDKTEGVKPEVVSPIKAKWKDEVLEAQAPKQEMQQRVVQPIYQTPQKEVRNNNVDNLIVAGATAAMIAAALENNGQQKVVTKEVVLNKRDEIREKAQGLSQAETLGNVEEVKPVETQAYSNRDDVLRNIESIRSNASEQPVATKEVALSNIEKIREEAKAKADTEESAKIDTAKDVAIEPTEAKLPSDTEKPTDTSDKANKEEVIVGQENSAGLSDVNQMKEVAEQQSGKEEVLDVAQNETELDKALETAEGDTLEVPKEDNVGDDPVLTEQGPVVEEEKEVSQPLQAEAELEPVEDVATNELDNTEVQIQEQPEQITEAVTEAHEAPVEELATEQIVEEIPTQEQQEVVIEEQQATTNEPELNEEQVQQEESIQSEDIVVAEPIVEEVPVQEQEQIQQSEVVVEDTTVNEIEPVEVVAEPVNDVQEVEIQQEQEVQPTVETPEVAQNEEVATESVVDVQAEPEQEQIQQPEVVVEETQQQEPVVNVQEEQSTSVIEEQQIEQQPILQEEVVEANQHIEQPQVQEEVETSVEQTEVQNQAIENSVLEEAPQQEVESNQELDTQSQHVENEVAIEAPEVIEEPEVVVAEEVEQKHEYKEPTLEETQEQVHAQKEQEAEMRAEQQIEVAEVQEVQQEQAQQQEVALKIKG